MTTWTPPADTSLSIKDINHLAAGLKDPASRDIALAYLATVTDPGLLYVLASRFGDRHHDRPSTEASAEGLRNFIRNRI